MAKVPFARLTTLPLRDAWTHEATDFTPWLAENLDHLSDLLGLSLELVDTEVAVDSYAADIVARNLLDDSKVLIENQLEASDHKHLGQIMTYLAGTEAKTVIWVADGFRQAHLSAIQWLNSHTADGFSFFAIRARVVRIGDSPYAPIFEIAGQPNDWERDLKSRQVKESSAYYDVKEEFWVQMIDRYPDLADWGFKRWRYPNNYVELAGTPTIQISAYFGKRESGLFLRSGRGEPTELVIERLTPARDVLETTFDAPFGPSARGVGLFLQSIPKGHEDRADWPEIMAWLYEKVSQYRSTLLKVLDDESAAAAQETAPSAD